MFNFEKARDQIDRILEENHTRSEVLANMKTRTPDELISKSVYTQDDIGVNDFDVIDAGADGGYGADVQKALNSLKPKKHRHTDNAYIRKFLVNTLGRSYLEYAKMRKKLDIPIESPIFRFWNMPYADQVLSLVNPGGLASVREGTFAINAMINVPPSVRLSGTGRASIFQIPAATNLTAIVRNKNYNIALDPDIEIDHLKLDGNKANGSTGHGLLLGGVTDTFIHHMADINIGGPAGRGSYIVTPSTSYQTNRIHLHHVFSSASNDSNVEFAGSVDGIDAGAVYNVTVKGLIGINSVTGRTIVMTNVKKYILDTVISSGAGHRGIDASYQSTDGIMSKLYVENCALDAITFADSADPAGPTSRHTISDFVIYRAGERGLHASANDLSIARGVIRECGFDGLRLNYDNCSVMGVISKNNSRLASSTYSGMDFRGQKINCAHNFCYDDQGTPTQKYGIALATGSVDCVAEFNTVFGNITAQIIDIGTNNVKRWNPGYKTENGGTSTQSGNGATTVFNIAHGLIAAPTVYQVSPGSADAKGDFHVTSDTTNLVVTYGIAPVNGSNNVTLRWRAATHTS